MAITKACEAASYGACTVFVRRRMKTARHNSKMKLKLVASAELREAASDDVIVINPEITVYLNYRIAWFYGCCATGRGLVALDRCYRIAVVVTRTA